MIQSGFDLSGTYPKINKDPGAVLPYTLDWADWLAEASLSGETIGNSTWEVTGSDAALVVDSSSTDGTKAQVVLSGGTLGMTYTVTNKIVLTPTSAYKDERSFQVTIVQR